MKDKTEKTPKKFNIVDFAIIAIVILLVAAVCWNLFSASKSATEEAEVQEEVLKFESSDHMRFTVECYKVPIAAAEVMVNSEDTQLNNNYQDLAAFITDVQTRPTTYTVTNADGSESVITDPETCTVIFVVEGYYDEETAVNDMAYKLGTQELRVGKGYVVKTKSIEFTGYVTAMEVIKHE